MKHLHQLIFLLCLGGTLLPGNSKAQVPTQAITGKVVAEDGSPLPGVTVQPKNGPGATITNGSGNFSIKGISMGTVLLFTSQGFEPLQLKVDERTVYQVTLKTDTKQLGEVRVVGYGTQRKAATTGSIASIKAADITQTPIANVAQGLAARVPGVQITQNNAAPGGSISVRIRGTNSINGSSEPLFIIDGIQIANGGGLTDVSPLSTINPSDIESVDILKDASATAIYGARAANGVVLITTKRGKAGVTKVQADAYYGIQQVTKTLKMLDAAGFARLENDVYKSNIYPNPDALGKGTDWQDVVLRQAPIQSYQVAVSGGADKTVFSLSANYFKQEGIIINSDLSRFSLRATLDHNISKAVKTGVSILTSYTDNNAIATNANPTDGNAVINGILGAALSAPPMLVPYKEDGSIYPISDQFNSRYREVSSPVGMAAKLNRRNIRRSLINVYVEAKLLKDLTYKSNFNVDLSSQLNDSYSPLSILGKSEINPTSGSAGKTNINTFNWLHESILTYNKDFGIHNLKFTGVWATQANNYNDNSISATGFPNDATTNEAIQLSLNRTVSSNRTKEALNSYMGRVNYGLANKYFVDLTARYDGASKFGANNKWGFFPAVGIAWRIIEEPFLKDSKWISDLKLRATYGATGNAAAIGPYQSLALEGPGNNYQFNHLYAIGISPTGIPNKDLRWEKSTQAMMGVDFGILQDRINFVVEAYDKETRDLLFVRNLPLSSGYASITGNFASIRNKGLEISADAKILTGKLKWNANANISFNRNKLLSLQGNTNEYVLNPFSVLRVGEPLGIFKTYVFDGIYQTGEAILPGSGSRTGGVKVKDLNNDHQITGDDQRITGQANPKYTVGFSSNLRYRSWDLSFFLAAVQGNQIFNLSRFSFENAPGGKNVLAGMANRWSPTNPNNEYPSGFQGGRTPVSDRFVEDGSYVRLKNISLGYKLPKMKGITSARVYISANNLFTITSYSGYDPEVNSFGGSNTVIGVDNIVYPAARSLLFGLQIGL